MNTSSITSCLNGKNTASGVFSFDPKNELSRYQVLEALMESGAITHENGDHEIIAFWDDQADASPQGFCQRVLEVCVKTIANKKVTVGIALNAKDKLDEVGVKKLALEATLLSRDCKRCQSQVMITEEMALQSMGASSLELLSVQPHMVQVGNTEAQYKAA